MKFSNNKCKPRQINTLLMFDALFKVNNNLCLICLILLLICIWHMHIRVHTFDIYYVSVNILGRFTAEGFIVVIVVEVVVVLGLLTSKAPVVLACGDGSGTPTGPS